MEAGVANHVWGLEEIASLANWRRSRPPSCCLFAGLTEIGGGYLMWLWWRDGRAWPFGLLGAAVLILYGIIPTYQAAHFGRVYAAYGGVFVVLSVLWGWGI